MKRSEIYRPAILALVGTIEPHANLSDKLTVNSADQRRQQYLHNFAQALRRSRGLVQGIVFAENSGADLEDFRALAASRDDVEVLSLPSLDVSPGMGRGYLETRLVAETFTRSKLISNMHDPLVVKQTGRYQLRNFDTMISVLDRSADLCINLRKFPKRWADMWFYAASRPGMRALEGRLEELREDANAGLPSERALFGLATQLKDDGLRVQLRFPREPHFSGYRGLDGVSYSSPRQEIKWVARTTVKRVAPGLWI